MSKASVKAVIDAAIKQNGTKSITGTVLNSVLNQMVDEVPDVVNDKTTGGTTKAWSAEQGKGLSADVSQLAQDVTEDELIMGDVIGREVSPNLFDKTQITPGYYVRRDNGALREASTHFTTDYIPIDSRGAYAPLGVTGGSYLGFACYDGAKVFTHGASSKTADYQSGDAYVRFSGVNADLDSFMVVAGTAQNVPNQYVRYGDIGYLKPQKDITNLQEEVTGQVQLAQWSLGSINTPSGGHIPDYTNNKRIRQPEMVCVLGGDYLITCKPGFQFLIYVVGKITTVTWTDSRLVSLEKGDIFRIAIKQNPEVDYSSYTQAQIDALGASVGLVMATDGLNDRINQVKSVKVTKEPKGNLFTLEGCIVGKYIYSSGAFVAGAAYRITDYIPVKASTNYFYSVAGANSYPGGSGYINFYDSHFKRISTTTSLSRSFTTPVGCAYVRVTWDSSYSKYPMLNEGSSRGNYTKYSAISGIPENGSRFAKFITTGTVANGSTLTGSGILSNRNFYAAFEIVGSISNSVTVGFGKGSGDGAGAIITPTKIFTIKGASDTQVFEYTHGLTLGARTRFIFSRSADGWVNFTLFDNDGNSYSGRNMNPHIGLPYVTNNTGASITATMSQSSRDSNKPILVCGDSYWSILDPARIPYHLDGWNYSNYELLARPGISGQDILPYFKSIINDGARPKYAVWDMGMNGGADSSGAVNSGWLSATQEFIEVCLQNGVTPILCTIPTIPGASHAALNDWVKYSGFRYIDFSAAVIDSNSNYWRNWGTEDALLYTDQVHPTTKGATVLAERILIDFPEIAVL